MSEWVWVSEWMSAQVIVSLSVRVSSLVVESLSERVDGWSDDKGNRILKF